MERSPKENQFNSIMCALFFMQYTFLIPIMRFINSTILVGIFGSIVLIGMLIRNGVKINKKILTFCLIFLLIILTKVIIHDSDFSVVLLIAVFTLPSALVMNYSFDYNVFLKHCINLSKISFLLIFWCPFASGHNYMRFGYGMLSVVIFAYLDLLYFGSHETKNEKIRTIINFLIIVVGTVEILVYGARGALVALALFIVIERFMVNKVISLKNIVLISIGLGIALNIVPLLNVVEVLAEKVGIYSYSVTKLKMQIEKGLAYASSGRDIIYSQSIEKIREHLFMGGKIVMDEDGGDYAHNLFLQVGQDLGIIAVVILMCFLIYVLYKICSKKTLFNEKIILCVLFSVSIGRLMFSSTIWRRPEFWMLLFFCLSMKANRHYANGKQS